MLTDPGQYQELIRGGGSLYTVLGRGTFHAELTTIQVGALRIQRGREALPRLARTSIPLNQIAILTWLDVSRFPIVRGVQVERGDILYLGQGEESHHRTSGRNEFVSVTLPLSLLRQAAMDLTGFEPKLAYRLLLRPPDHLRDLLCSVLTAALRLPQTSPDILLSPLAAASLQLSIMQGIVLCLEHSEAHKERVQRRQRAVIAKRFEAAVEANLDHTVSIPDLARSIGASGRTLRNLCQEQLGVSPQRFVALRRLHRIRDALSTAEYRSETVTDIAMRFGVWELGRFAVTYKSVFGEAPSETLRRSA